MRVAPAIIVIFAACAGCATPPPQPTELPQVTANDYDLLWDTTVQVVEEHFDLFVKRKDEGYIVSTYKRGEPLPGTSGLKTDAQTGYDRAEEFMHIVRRRLTARVFQQEKGVATVKIEVIRERQAYVPPPPDYATYDLYEPGTRVLNDAADQTATVTWRPLGRDIYLENKLLARIRARLPKRSAK